MGLLDTILSNLNGDPWAQQGEGSLLSSVQKLLSDAKRGDAATTLSPADQARDQLYRQGGVGVPGIQGSPSGPAPMAPPAATAIPDMPIAGAPYGSEPSSIAVQPADTEASSIAAAPAPAAPQAPKGMRTGDTIATPDLGPSMGEMLNNLGMALQGHAVPAAAYTKEQREGIFKMLKSGQFGQFDDATAQVLARNPAMLESMFGDRFKSPQFSQIGTNEIGFPQYGFVKPQTGEITPAGPSPSGDESSSPIAAIGEGIINGEQPPTLTGMYKYGPAVRAYLARKGFDLSKANLEWESAHKQVLSLNGPQMVRYAGLSRSVINTIDEVNELARQMDNSGIPLANKAKIAMYAQTMGNTEKGQLASKYIAAVNTLKEEFANLAQGGYAPTEAAWGLANSQINGDYGVKQLNASLNEVQRLLRYRLQGIPNFQTLGPGASNRFVGGGQVQDGGHGAPTQQPQQVPPSQHAAVLDEARRAISAGKDPGAVRARLQQLGVDPSQLDAGMF